MKALSHPTPRGLLLWPLHHDYLRQRGAGGDRQPHAALSVSVPPQLHGPGLSATLAGAPGARPLRHGPGCLRRQPQPGGCGAPCLPLQGCRPLRLRGHLHGGEPPNGGSWGGGQRAGGHLGWSLRFFPRVRPLPVIVKPSPGQSLPNGGPDSSPRALATPPSLSVIVLTAPLGSGHPS